MLDLDHVPYMAGFLLGLAGALALGCWLFTRASARTWLPAERLSLAVCPAAIFIVLFQIGVQVAKAPELDWNSARLAPVVGLLHGVKLYAPRAGSGVVMNTIYPPMSYLAYLPAAVFSRPTAAIMAASCISAALSFGPAVLLAFAGPSRRSPLFATAVVLAFTQVVCATSATTEFAVHADAPAIAFAAVSCVALYLGGGRSESTPSIATCAVSAFFASLAVWSKQTLAPALVVLPIWVAVVHGWRLGFRYALALGLVLLAISLVFCLTFGFGSLTFNLFSIPSHHPWKYSGPNRTRGVVLVVSEFVYYCVWSVILIPFTAIARRYVGADEATGEHPGAGHIRGFLAEDRWVLFALVALAVVPTGFLGRIKVGGNPNSYAPTIHFLALALAASLIEWHAANSERGLVGRNAALTLTLFVSGASPLARANEMTPAVFNSLHRVSWNNQEAAFRYARRHPGTAYFPWNPLSSLLAEGRLYHFEYGLTDRELAGFTVSERHFRAGVPGRLQYVCFPPFRQDEHTMRYLPEFTRRVAVKELPGWICYER